MLKEQEGTQREARKKPPPDGGMWNSRKAGRAGIERRTGKAIDSEEAEGLGVHEEVWAKARRSAGGTHKKANRHAQEAFKKSLP